jgi:hypothetical protein
VPVGSGAINGIRDGSEIDRGRPLPRCDFTPFALSFAFESFFRPGVIGVIAEGGSFTKET